MRRLARILKRLNDGADPAAVRREARESLSSISPADLSRAEQRLLEAGTTPEELRHLCAIHVEIVGDQAQEMMSKLNPGHILRTMLREHEIMRDSLAELGAVARAIRRMDRRDARRREFRRLRQLAMRLLATESHHKREEEVLFPELERKGIPAPGRIMATEHEELRERMRELLQLAENLKQMDFADFKERLDTTATLIVLTLREHILKENTMLYPTALEVIDDERVWARMKAESYRIGVASFTPEV